MRVSSSSFILFFNLLLGGIASYVGGSLLSVWLHHEVLSLSDSRSGKFSITTKNLPFDPGKSEDYFSVILDRNVFNAQKKEVVFNFEPTESSANESPTNEVISESKSQESDSNTVMLA